MSILHKLTSLSYFGDLLFLNEHENNKFLLIKQTFKFSSYFTYLISIVCFLFIICLSITNIINYFLANSTITFLLENSIIIFIKTIGLSLITFSFVRSLIITILSLTTKNKFEYLFKKYLKIIRLNFIVTLLIYLCILAILIIYPHSVKYATIFYIGLFLLTPIKTIIFIYYRRYIYKYSSNVINEPLVFKTLNLFAIGDYHYLLTNNELKQTRLARIYYLHTILLTLLVFISYCFAFGFILPFIQGTLTAIFYFVLILIYLIANLYLFITSILVFSNIKLIKNKDSGQKSYLNSIFLNAIITFLFQIAIIIISVLSFKFSIDRDFISLFISLFILIKVGFYLNSRRKLTKIA